MKSGQEQRNGKTRPRLHGQATVELALAATFLFLLLIGIADVARIFTEQQAVVHAAGIGARWMTIDPNGKACSGYGSSVEAIVREDIGNAVPQGGLRVGAGATSANGISIVTVSVTYTHNYLFGLIRGVPSVFTGKAAMPGTDTGAGTCPPPSVATVTRTPYPTPGPSGTPTATGTPTRTFTNTP